VVRSFQENGLYWELLEFFDATGKERRDNIWALEVELWPGQSARTPGFLVELDEDTEERRSKRSKSTSPPPVIKTDLNVTSDGMGPPSQEPLRKEGDEMYSSQDLEGSDSDEEEMCFTQEAVRGHGHKFKQLIDNDQEDHQDEVEPGLCFTQQAARGH